MFKKKVYNKASVEQKVIPNTWLPDNPVAANTLCQMRLSKLNPQNFLNLALCVTHAKTQHYGTHRSSVHTEDDKEYKYSNSIIYTCMFSEQNVE